MKWKTKDGQILEMTEMETSHIQNCIKMLERQLREAPGYQAYSGDSDYAQQAVDIENDINEELKENIDGVIREFQGELKKRSDQLNS